MLVYRSYEEKVLLQRLAAGDENAFTELYDRHHAFLKGWVLKFVKWPDLAEDIVQEIFLKIWEGRSSLSELNSLRAYLVVVSRNHTLHLLKRVARDQAAKAQVIRWYEQGRNAVEEDVLSKEYRRQLTAVLQTLPEQTRTVFRLCREEQMSYEEVARLLGISRNAVKKHMVRTGKTFRYALQMNLDISLPLVVVLTIFRF